MAKNKPIISYTNPYLTLFNADKLTICHKMHCILKN